VSFGRSSFGSIPFGLNAYVVEQPPLEGGHRAIILMGGVLHQIPDDQIGLGWEPVTLWRGQLVEYDLTKFLQAGELGIPLIFLDGRLQTLPEGENLIL
jgi:hypothetical protein